MSLDVITTITSNSFFAVTGSFYTWDKCWTIFYFGHKAFNCPSYGLIPWLLDWGSNSSHPELHWLWTQKIANKSKITSTWMNSPTASMARQNSDTIFVLFRLRCLCSQLSTVYTRPMLCLGLSCSTNLWYITLNTFGLKAMDFASQVMQNDFKDSHKKEICLYPLWTIWPKHDNNLLICIKFSHVTVVTLVTLCQT